MAQRGSIFRKGNSWLLRYNVKEEHGGTVVWVRRVKKLTAVCDEYPTKESAQPLADAILAPINKKIYFQPSIFIYALVSSREFERTVWYVGQSVDVDRRFTLHTNGQRREGSRKCAWFNKEIADGFTVTAKLIEECRDQFTADEREAYWIGFFRDRNPLLTNGTTGAQSQRFAELAKVQEKCRKRLVQDREWLDKLFAA